MMLRFHSKKEGWTLLNRVSICLAFSESNSEEPASKSSLIEKARADDDDRGVVLIMNHSSFANLLLGLERVLFDDAKKPNAPVDVSATCIYPDHAIAPVGCRIWQCLHAYTTEIRTIPRALVVRSRGIASFALHPLNDDLA